MGLLPLSRQNLRPMPTMDMEAMVDTVMAVMDTVDTVERDLLMPMPTMDMVDMDVVMDMVVTDMVDTVASDLLKLKPMPPLKLNQKLKPSHGTDMDTPDTHTLMVDMDTHTLMLVLTSLARDLPNHPHTTVMDTDVVMDMAATDMAVNSYFQEAKRFYYLIFKIDV